MGLVETIFFVLGITLTALFIGWMLDKEHPETYDEGYMGEDEVDE